MATKVKQAAASKSAKSAHSAKSAPAKSEAKSPKSAAKLEKKGGKGAAKGEELQAASETQDPGVDPEELEEQQAEAAAAGGGGNAAALAAASGSTEMSASFKNFRHHPDMENFYRFIYDNDLRHEALAIIDEMMGDKMKRKQLKSAKANAH